jgi:hypothetical protein
MPENFYHTAQHHFQEDYSPQSPVSEHQISHAVFIFYMGEYYFALELTVGTPRFVINAVELT